MRKKSVKKNSSLASPRVTETQISFFESLSIEPIPIDLSPLIQNKAPESLPIRPSVSVEPKILSITELSTRLRDNLRTVFQDVCVQGEIADFKGIHRSGHLYFALKDETSQIRAVMWKGALQKLPFEIKGGLEVLIRGKIDFYGGSGSVQIVVEHMEPLGIGALQLRFEQLKEKLKKEGLFDTSRKRHVAPLNWRIGIVTGKSTAALQDMLKIFGQRFPLAEVYFFHSAVQGENAPKELVSAIQKANKFSLESKLPLDVLIVGRGGGSYEDLFCFNDESLARAIAASKIPTVSAVGHEIDWTIADLIADKRAATPSHAAQETVPERSNWLEKLNSLETKLTLWIENLIQDYSQKIDYFYNRLISSSPQRKIEFARQQIELRNSKLTHLIKSLLDGKNAQLHRYASLLDAYSPLKVLDRGYSILKDAEGKPLKSTQMVKVDDLCELQLSDGTLRARVLSKHLSSSTQ